MQEQGQRHQNEPTGDPVEYAMVDGVESSARRSILVEWAAGSTVSRLHGDKQGLEF
jgi:hypothetical protein